MTDPRFYGWLWEMENEIRPLFQWFIIMFGITIHIPKYNKKWYDSTDVIASISKVTYDVVNNVAPS
jgi:hypothetical protein